MKVKALVARSYPILCDPMDCNLPVSPVHGIFQARILEYSLLQGIFSTQGSKPGLLHCRQILHYLSHQGSPIFSPHTYSYCRLQNLYPPALNCWKPCFHLTWSLDGRENSMKQHLSGRAYLWRQETVGKIMLDRIQKIQLDVKWSSGNTWEYPPLTLSRPQWSLSSSVYTCLCPPYKLTFTHLQASTHMGILTLHHPSRLPTQSHNILHARDIYLHSFRMTTSWIFNTPQYSQIQSCELRNPASHSFISPVSYLFGLGQSDILWLFRFSPMSQHAHTTTLSARDTWGHLGLTGVWIHNSAEHLHKSLGLDASQACLGLALSLMPILPTFPVPGSRSPPRNICPQVTSSHQLPPELPCSLRFSTLTQTDVLASLFPRGQSHQLHFHW